MSRRLSHILVMAGLVLAACLVLLLVCIPIYLNSSHFQALAMQTLDRTIPGKVRWRAMNLSLYAGEVDFEAMALAGPDGSEIAGIDRLKVRWRWRELIRGALVLSGEVEKPRVNLEQHENGRLNLMVAFPEGDGGETAALPLNIVIESLRLSGGSLQLRVDGRRLSAGVRGIDMALSGDLARREAQIDISLEEGKFALEGVDTRLKPSALEARYADKRVNLIRLDIQTDTGGAVIRGSLEDPAGSPRLNLTADLHAGLGLLDGLLGGGARLTGDAELHLKLEGAPENPDADLTLAYGGGIVFDRPVDNLTGRLTLRDRQLAIEHLGMISGPGSMDMNGRIDLRPVFPAGFFDPHSDFEALAYDLRLDQKQMALTALLGSAAGVNGDVDAGIVLKGRGFSPKHLAAAGTIEVSATGVTTDAGIPPVSLKLESRLELDQGRMAVHSLKAEAGEMQVDARGAVDIYAGTVSADFSLAAPRLYETLSPLGITDVRGRANAGGTLSGTFKQPRFDLRFDGSDLRYGGIHLGELELEAALDTDGLLRVRRLMLQNRGSTIKGQGEIQILNKARRFQADAPLSLDLTLTDIEALDFVDRELASGRLDGEVTLTGSMGSPRGRLNLRGRGIAVESYRLGDITAALDFVDGRLTLEKVRVVNGDSRLELAGSARIIDPGTFRLLPDPQFDLTLTGENIALDEYLPDFAGRFSISARLDGSLKKPKGPISIAGRNFESQWQNLDRLALNARLDGDSMWVDDLSASPAADEWITLKGRVTLEGFSDAELTTAGLSLAHIDLLKDKIDARGTLSGTLKGGGEYTNPAVSGSIVLRQFEAAGKPVDDLRADMRLADREAWLDLQHTDARLTGSYHLLRRTFSAAGGLYSDDLSPYFALFGLADLGGRVSGEIKIDGDASRIEAVTVSGLLETLRLDWRQREMVSTRDARLTYDNGQFKIPGWDLRLLERGNLYLEGSGRVGGNIDIETRGKVPLAVGRMFASDLQDLDGDLEVSASATGAWHDPELKGTLTLRSLAMTVPVLDQTLHGVNGTLTLTPDRIFISGLNGKLDGGELKLNGSVDLENIRPQRINLSLATTNLPLGVPDTLDVFVDSRLDLTGTPDDALLNGEVALRDGTYYKDVALSPLDMLNREPTRAVEPEAPEITVPYLKKLRLNVSLNSRNPFEVDNNLAELEIVPEIRVTGTLKRPEVTGRTDIPTGVIKFQTRRFEVTRGSLDFVDRFAIHPEIDLRAETEIRRWEVYVDVTGPVNSPELELTSDPHEEPGDVLSLILTGRTSREIMAGEGGGTLAQAELIAGLANSALGEEVKSAIGLDTLEADTVSDRDDDSESTRVTLGKNLSERVSLKYGVKAKDGEMVQKAIVEYRLLERLLVSGFQDNRGVYGGALRYRIDFR